MARRTLAATWPIAMAPQTHSAACSTGSSHRRAVMAAWHCPRLKWSNAVCININTHTHTHTQEACTSTPPQTYMCRVFYWLAIQQSHVHQADAHHGDLTTDSLTLRTPNTRTWCQIAHSASFFVQPHRARTAQLESISTAPRQMWSVWARAPVTTAADGTICTLAGQLSPTLALTPLWRIAPGTRTCMAVAHVCIYARTHTHSFTYRRQRH